MPKFNGYPQNPPTVLHSQFCRASTSGGSIGAVGAIAAYGVELILFIVVFLQKLNHYPLYCVQNQ